jgi:hypothetical protein
MHRLIVTSAAYRQSSQAAPKLLARDPGNVLVARQARLRLPAELIRDSALAAGGLLDPEIGGRSVRPPQPAGASPHKWAESSGGERYRRGMYIELYRTAPYPLLANFDAPNGYGAACRRNRSTTPLQALNLLNDPVFVEAAQGLAARALAAAEATPARLDAAFRISLARSPEADERGWLLAYHERQRAWLDAHPDAAKTLMPRDPTPEAAAWAGVASVLLNVDEFLTRE